MRPAWCSHHLQASVENRVSRLWSFAQRGIDSHAPHAKGGQHRLMADKLRQNSFRLYMGPAVSAQNSVPAVSSEASSGIWALIKPKSKSTRNLRKMRRSFNRSLSFPSRRCRTGSRSMLSRPIYVRFNL